MAIHEVAEHIEHAAHGGHGDGRHDGGGHGGGIGRLAGITMAILGVMLAFCAALVGGARTELIATMVAQSNTYQKYQAQRMKHRMMITQLAALHALSPSRRDLRQFEEDLAGIHQAGKGDAGDAAEIEAAIGLSTKALVRILEPRAQDEARLLAMAGRYADETEAAQKWAESYEEKVEAHTAAAEHFEWGQLAAEIGIVIASVALLLANRRAWYLAVAFGSACAGLLLWTYVSTRGHAVHAEAEIEKTQAVYTQLRKTSGADKDDEEILAEVGQRISEMQPALLRPPAPRVE